MFMQTVSLHVFKSVKHWSSIRIELVTNFCSANTVWTRPIKSIHTNVTNVVKLM